MNELAQNHKKLVSQIFNDTADLYATVGPNFFNYFGNKIVEYAEIDDCDVVLDAACGRGASLIPAIKKLGKSGKIIGIDLASKMIEKTKIEIENLCIRNIELYEMDIEELALPSNKFDVVLCGFSLFFLPDIKKD